MAEGMPTTPPDESARLNQTIVDGDPAWGDMQAAAEDAVRMRDASPAAEGESPWAATESAAPADEIDTSSNAWVSGAAKESWNAAETAANNGNRQVGVFNPNQLGEFQRGGISFTPEALNSIAEKAAQDALNGTGGSNLEQGLNKAVHGSDDLRQKEMQEAARQAMLAREQNLQPPEQNDSPWAS